MQRKPNRDEMAAEALANATGGESLANYPAIFEGFEGRGIPTDEIRPRENVFTFNAWRALGRTVRKGMRGVSVVTVLRFEDKNGNSKSRPKRSTVFHVWQTARLDGEPDEHSEPAAAWLRDPRHGNRPEATGAAEPATAGVRPRAATAHYQAAPVAEAAGADPATCAHPVRVIAPGMPCRDCGQVADDQAPSHQAETAARADALPADFQEV